MAEAIVVDRAGGAAASIAQEAQKAERCTRCPLYRNATQVVFGEGSAQAHVMLVGEQPADRASAMKLLVRDLNHAREIAA